MTKISFRDVTPHDAATLAHVLINSNVIWIQSNDCI